MWPVSDDALLAGLAAGDARSATEFVRRFQARVFGLALAIVSDRKAAEEIAQETFVRAWRHAGAYDTRRAAVSTWLLTITRNLAIDELRLRRPDPIDPAAVRDRERALWTALTADANEQREELRAGLHTLSEAQRRAVLLAALFGFTAREIAAIESVPLGTAKTRIRDGLNRLRRALESDPGPREGGT